MNNKYSPSTIARSVPFDNRTNGFVSTNVQNAIEEARGAVDAAKEIAITIIAGELLPAFRFVYIDANGMAYLGDYKDMQKAEVVGFTKQELQPNEQGIALVFGRIDDPSFMIASGVPIYLLENGEYTTATIPAGNFIKPVGQGLRLGSLFVNIKELRFS